MSRQPKGAATPALAAVGAASLWHRVHTYHHDPAVRQFGDEAAEQLGIDPARIYKTLVITTADGRLANAVLAVADMLNLKLLAKALGVKQVVMADAGLAMRKTGYVLGGISPVGQKSTIATVIDTSVHDHETVFVSGGQRGLSLELLVPDVVQLTSGIVAPIRRSSN